MCYNQLRILEYVELIIVDLRCHFGDTFFIECLDNSTSPYYTTLVRLRTFGGFYERHQNKSKKTNPYLV